MNEEEVEEKNRRGTILRQREATWIRSMSDKVGSGR